MVNKNRSHSIQNIKQNMGITCPKCNPDELCEECHQEYIETEIDYVEYQMEDR